MSYPNRYRVANNQAQLTLGGGILAVDPAGPLVMYDDYARLKAEVERLKEGNECLDKMHEKEMARSAYLCEQVERLEKGIQPEGSNDAVGRAVNVLLEKEKENARLKAEVERLEKTEEYLQNTLNQYALDDMRLQAKNERLRKAGDGMEEVIWLQGCLSGMEIKERAVKAWKQAKEGKQS